MQKPLTIAVLAALFATGCAFSPVKRPNPQLFYNNFDHSRSVNLPVAEALDAARSAVEAVGFEVQSVTAELGLIRSKAMSVAIPAVCDCGTWNMSPVSGSAELALTVTVTARDAGAMVAVEGVCGTNFSGQNLYGATTRRETYQCASRGTLEQRFWTALGQIVATRTKR